MHPTDKAYAYLSRFTTVDHQCEPASSARYWVTTHVSLNRKEEFGRWVYGSGLRELAKAFGCKLYA